ncbi:uncharacterized protein [Prorops nasuta]|uniref:uncharacterized protein n=1 Tax=Prorops nasuta TaxID=863751 RepID=UPI0034CFB7CE
MENFNDRSSLITVILVVNFTLVVSVIAEDKYTNRFDNINVDEILKSERLLNNYFKCLMDKGRCTSEGLELKRLLPDALETDCIKCSKSQKNMAKTVINYIVKNNKAMWQDLIRKYDPEGLYRVKFEDEAIKAGINVKPEVVLDESNQDGFRAANEAKLEPYKVLLNEMMIHKMGHASLVLLTLAIIHCVLAASEDVTTKYTTKYDQIDIDSIIRNDRLVNNYIGCLLDQNPCPPEAAELKKNLPDALQTACASCSEAQKNVSDKFAHYIIDHKPDEWKLLENKYDPSGDYKKRYLDNA